MKKQLLTLFVIIQLVACNTAKNSFIAVEEENWITSELPSDLAIKQTLFLIGELGSSNLDKNPLKPILKREFTNADSNTSVIFLGSHLYPKGLSGKSKPHRAQQEQKLLSTFSLLDNYKGNYFFISGEHDWEYRGDKGLKAIKRMEDFAEDYFPAKDFFLPEDGCGDPVKVKVADDVVLLFINTQWWLEDWENEKKINKGCNVKSRTEFIDELREKLNKHHKKNLFVIMHHPLYSNGIHGGNIPAKYHFFPLTEIKPKAYLPLPIFGSIAAMHRNISGTKQDLANRQIKILHDELTPMFHKKKDIVFIASHDQSLQYFQEQEQHWIVSGSAGGEGYARKGGKARFASAKSGYSKIIVYENDAVWLEFYGLENSKMKLLFRKELKAGKSELEEVLEETELTTEWQDSITAIPGELYDIKKFKRFWFGNTYRDIWDMPIKAQMLDITKEHGGLIPIKKGGGQQSNSLRLEDPDGKQYVFRSIMKSAYKETPEFLRNTWGQNVVQDMLSASHPYGAFVIPTLSKAAEIYYTEPQLVYIPKQVGLGIYNESFGDELYLYEDRPNGNRSDLDGFGNSTDIIGINDLLPELQKNYDHVVDQVWTVRSRIFDIWVHDWDRHDDQWRWATFKEDDKTIYRPIPRDRDQVFFTFDGPLPFLASNFVLKKFRTFKYHLKQPKHQSNNASHFDRYFLNELEKSTWIEQAERLQSALTDSVIYEAFKAWPKEVYEKDGDEIIAKLKSRRALLPKIAGKLYDFLAKEVNVLGTEKGDKFKVERQKDGTTIVRVYDLDKKGKKKDKYYERTFYKNETKEIRLYGLGGDDEFEIEGEGKKGIKIRIIAGSGKDKVDDKANVRGLKKLTKVYDEKDGLKLEKSKETQDRTSNRYDVNEYDREQDHINTYIPLVNFGSNFDDGFFFGGGLIATLKGFRGTPYKAKHSINFLYAPATNAFSLSYKLDRIGTFYRLNSDFIFEALFQDPVYTNFYGRGNKTVLNNELPKQYNFVRLDNYKIKIGTKKNWLNGRYIMRLGSFFESTDVDEVPNRVSEDPTLMISAEDKSKINHLGAFYDLQINTIVNEGARPVEGFKFNFEAYYFNQIKSKNHFSTINGSASYFVSFFKKMPTTFATRIGVGANLGGAPFYRGVTLGGSDNLRGYRNERFSGEVIFYQNIDLRIKFYYWENKILPLEFGILGGFDYGRVWIKGEKDNYMHKGYTAGIWMSPFKVVNLTFNSTFSKEDRLFNFGFGFFF